MRQIVNSQLFNCPGTLQRSLSHKDYSKFSFEELLGAIWMTDFYLILYLSNVMCAPTCTHLGQFTFS